MAIKNEKLKREKEGGPMNDEGRMMNDERQKGESGKRKAKVGRGRERLARTRLRQGYGGQGLSPYLKILEIRFKVGKFFKAF